MGGVLSNTKDQGTVGDRHEEPSFNYLPGWKGNMQKLNNMWMNWEINLLLVFLVAMCLGCAAQWLLRAFFNVGYIWLGEFVKYTLMWSGFLGGCIATTRLQHFRVDLLRIIPPENRNIITTLRVLSYITGFVFCVILAFATFKYIKMLISYNETTAHGMPVWPLYLIVLYFYLTSAFRFFMTALLKVL